MVTMTWFELKHAYLEPYLTSMWTFFAKKAKNFHKKVKPYMLDEGPIYVSVQPLKLYHRILSEAK